MAITTTAAIFRKSGDTLDITAAANIPAGAIKVIDGCNCLAQWPIANGETGVLKVLQRGEVVEVKTDDAIGATNAGVPIYVIPATGLVTKSADDGGTPTPTAYSLLGYTRAAVGASDLSFEVVCA
ncbi:MAG: hypothetical protein J6V72_11025 [Kiritimatiellae bacterium]|nr:hypothetical protein [Kiritimatiellia bacterium]